MAGDEMEEKIPRHYLYIVVFLLLAVGAILAWNYTAGKKAEPGGVAGALEGKNSELEERERQIQALDEQVAQLRKELDAGSRKAAELQDRLDDTRRALSSTEQKLSSAVRQGGPARRACRTGLLSFCSVEERSRRVSSSLSCSSAAFLELASSSLRN